MTINMVNTCYVVKYKKFDYIASLELQNKIREIKEGDRTFKDFVFLLQHNPVFTIGRQGTRAEILVSNDSLKSEGISTVNVERGGKVTYHGPGQLVVYFLLDLIKNKLSVPDFVWKMEETVIKTILKWEIEGKRRENHPGVWVKIDGIDRKIAAIGARASKKITSHGLAVNVNTNMNHFGMIIPCGIKTNPPISMKQILNREIEMAEVYSIYQRIFENVFQINTEEISNDELMEKIINAKN